MNYKQNGLKFVTGDTIWVECDTALGKVRFRRNTSEAPQDNVAMDFPLLEDDNYCIGVFINEINNKVTYISRAE